ncbi:MAG: DNA polymerase III subunit gamma/tau, partial [Sphingobacteriia bacterium 35-40-8]
IVSFTNGTVTYQNTLEHLNILDEDYFFQLLDCMRRQDMAGAMLLFDQINRKGFEGDLVLNGFAEFIRNLLVCKDAKSASLLEVVEGMQAKYIQVAQQTSLSYLLSALNILNDTEVNYKMARNKRLHVELALIKLSFLQQAIELTTDKGTVVKKKRVDGPIAFKTKMIQSLAPPAPPTLPGQAAVKPSSNPTQPSAAHLSSSTPEAKLFVAQTAAPTPAPVGTIKTGPKKSLLEALKEKAGSNYEIEEVKEAMPLTEESLRAFWDAYIVQLEQQLKHSAVGTFRIASLEIESDIHFTVRVSAVTAQKFIESEKMVLIDQLQTQFNNRAINFTILVEEGEKEDVPLHMRLNSKQKFERIAEQYPLVRELRDKLRLEIDY